MFYKSFFLFFFLFSFFSLELNYKAGDLESQTNSKNFISLSWSMAFAVDDGNRKGNSVVKINNADRTAQTNSTAQTSKIPQGSVVFKECKIGYNSEKIKGIIDDNNLKADDYSSSNTPNEFRRKQKVCEELLEKRDEQKKQCKVDYNKIQEAGFGKACANFARGMKCKEAIMACSMCPSPEEDSNFNSYNCVRVHKQSKCPLLAGEELKLAKEKRDDFQEEVEEMEEDVNEQEQEIVEKQNELNKNLAELEESFNEAVLEFKRDAENAKEDLEADLNKNKAAIKNEVSKQIAQAQEVVDKSLEIAHSFENAITEANMKHRLETKKIYAECRMQAQTQLAKFKHKRRRAIESGSYKVSLSALTNKNRVSFAVKDKNRIAKYYRQCVRLRNSEIKDLKLVLQQRMRVIAQQKEQYQQKIEALKQKVASLNKMALEQQNDLLKDYAKKMTKITSQYSEAYGNALKNYERNKKTLMAETSKINVLQKQLMEKKAMLRQKKQELLTEQQLIAYLKSKGVSEENDDSHSAFSSAAEALDKYDSAIAEVDSSCCEDDLLNEKKCKKLEKMNEKHEDNKGLEKALQNIRGQR